MGPIGCPETSVRNYHCPLRNSPKERISEVLSKSGDMFKRRLKLYSSDDNFTLIITYIPAVV
jgi:hypothetical protein